MSTTGNSSQTKSYFCYQCDRTVTISIAAAADPLCPICNQGFLEESDNPDPSPFSNLNPNRPVDPISALFPLLFPNAATASPDFSNIFGNPSPNPNPNANPSPDQFDPFAFLQNYIGDMRSGGAQIQFVIENHPSDHTGFRLPGNLGDYFIGPGLEQLIQQLAENDPNRYGTPPASKSAIDKLPTIKVSKEMLGTDMNQCAVCMDEFDEGMEVKQMPCKHIYHIDCIMPWLELHNSCPVCRYELPTDDPDYESRRSGGQGNSSQAAGNSGGSGGGAGGGTERRFRISVPWPFRSSENSGGGASNSQGSGFNSEPRDEGLD